MPESNDILSTFVSLYKNEEVLEDKWYEFLKLRKKYTFEALEIITRFAESIKNQCQKCLMVSVPSINDGQQFEGWKITEDLYLAKTKSDATFRLFEKWEGKEIKPQSVAVPVGYLGINDGEVAGTQKAIDSIFSAFFPGKRSPKIKLT